MSTRACIAYAKTDCMGTPEWEGIYSHSDGYPTWLGKQIWDVLHRDFLGNKGDFGVGNKSTPENAVRAFIDIYIKGHPAGWSSFGNQCYCHDPAFVLRDGVQESKITNEYNDPLSIEYVYILEEETCTMYILEAVASKKAPVALKKNEYTTILGKNKYGSIVNYGHCVYEHKLLATVNLLGSEPDWNKIESGGSK